MVQRGENIQLFLSLSRGGMHNQRRQAESKSVCHILVVGHLRNSRRPSILKVTAQSSSFSELLAALSCCGASKGVRRLGTR